jgi:hypothetical protein
LVRSCIAERMRCESPGSNQNGASSSFGSGGRMLAGEVEVVREPALADQEMYELLGGRDVLAVFKDRGAVERSLDGERLAMGAGGPSGRRLRRLRKLQTHSRSA